MSKTVKEHCFARISVISQPFWLFLGSFRQVNLCGLRLRVDSGTGEGQAELPVGYPRQSLVICLPVPFIYVLQASLKGVLHRCI